MRTLAGFVICIAVLCSGCESGPKTPPLFPVSGKVTSKGAALKDCTISFIPVNQFEDMPSAYVGKLDANGSYTLEDSLTHKPGAAAGEYKVILQQSPEAAKAAMMSGRGGPGGAAPFPPEYSDPVKTPKKVTVKSEPNTINVDI